MGECRDASSGSLISLIPPLNDLFNPEQSQSEDSPNTRTNVATSRYDLLYIYQSGVYAHELYIDSEHLSNSFFLTPLNYFDSDVSMESTNAILLSAPCKPGQPFRYTDYDVKPLNCIPPQVPPFEYTGLIAYNLDGTPALPASLTEMRNAAELYHRIEVAL